MIDECIRSLRPRSLTVRAAVAVLLFGGSAAAFAACPSGTTDNGLGDCTSLNGTFSSFADLYANPGRELLVINGHVTSTGTLQVDGGTSAGNATVDVGGNFTIASGVFRAYSGPTVNNGTFTINSSLIDGYQGSVANITNNGTLNNNGQIQNGWNLSNSGTGSSWSITNTGVIRNAGTLQNGAVIYNSGTINNLAGATMVLSDVVSGTGSATAQGLAYLGNTGSIVNSGTFSVTGASIVTGSGSITNNGTLNVSSQHNGNNSQVLDPTVTFGSSTNLVGGTLTGGTWNVSSAAYTSPPFPGNLYETATLTVGSGAITAIGAGTTINLTGQDSHFDQLASLNHNSGTFQLNDRAWTFASGFVNDGTVNVSLNGTMTDQYSHITFYPAASTVRVTDTLTNNGTLSISGANVTAPATSGATYTIANTGNLTFQGSLVSATSINNSGSLTVSGSTVSSLITNSGKLINSSSANTLAVQSNSASGVITNGGAMSLAGSVNGGQITNTGTLDLSGTTNNGAVAQNGGTVTVSSGTTLGGTGSYTQAGGITVVNGTMQQGFQMTGGTLKGSGTINGDLIASGGTIAPGNSPGTLTITGNATLAGSTIDLEIGGTGPGQHDLLNILGTANLTGADIMFDFINGYAPKAGDALSLYVAAAGGITGANAANYSVEGLQSGFNYSIGPDGTLTALSDGAPTTSPVPLPAAAWLMLSGLGGFGAMARRRKAV